MVVLSQPIPEDLTQFETCMSDPHILTDLPVIDLWDRNCKKPIVQACRDFGFFKVVNHGVSMEFLSRFEEEALSFFKLPREQKENSYQTKPFGYGNKKIGPNGDVGWVEYILLQNAGKAINPGLPETLWGFIIEYAQDVKNMMCLVLDMITDELQIGPKDLLSRLVRDETSDTLLRLNYYPPCPMLQALSGQDLIGFGAHTDPQILSVLRSTNASGLQICLKDGFWASVPPDPTSFYFNVGDSLQVMTNGRLRSVKHRVLANSLKPRLSMIYFGGPPVSEKIRPLSSLMEDGEESLYEEFTWSEYKKWVYKTRLSDDRLGFFKKNLNSIKQVI